MNKGLRSGFDHVASPRASENFNSPSSVWTYRFSTIALFTCNSWDWIFVTASASVYLPPNPAIGDQVAVVNQAASTSVYANVGQTVSGTDHTSFAGTDTVAIFQYDRTGNWDVISCAGTVAAGDLSGHYPNPTVAAIAGASVSAPGNSGQILVASGTTSTSWTQGLTILSSVGIAQNGASLTSGSQYTVLATTSGAVALQVALTVGTWLVVASVALSGASQAGSMAGVLTSSSGTMSLTAGGHSNVATSSLTAQSISCVTTGIVAVTVNGNMGYKMTPTATGTLVTGPDGQCYMYAVRIV